VKAAEEEELERRLLQYRGGRSHVPLTGRTAILVDDGLATGVTARVACRFLKERGAVEVILAVPVCPASARAVFEQEADEFVCLEEPYWFGSVGQFYEDFSPVSDQQVTDLLAEAAREMSLEDKSARKKPAPPLVRPEEVLLRGPGLELRGVLAVPTGAKGLVLFAHGSGSNYMSPRNRAVAGRITDAGFATLLFDLLTPEESANYELVFDIPLLASRLRLATEWVDSRPELRELPLGYFGASTGAGAALWAAAELGPRISAIVSRGGRPDLAMPRLRAVAAPTLLIVGGYDVEVIELNRKALARLDRGKLAVIPQASHLFEEPGKIEEVGKLALEWYERHLPRARAAGGPRVA
jgi:putative phosphoribosyl transferase